jgi:hypothetical protein
LVEFVEFMEEVSKSLDVEQRAHVNVKAVLGYLHRIRMPKSSLLQEIIKIQASMMQHHEPKSSSFLAIRCSCH